MVKLIAKWSAVRPICRKSQLLHKNGDNLVTRSIVWQFYRYTFVFG